ncbi:MAG: RagB/SusD family nutrient uptake outer membrane protein [Bacteroidales bacterium]
MKRHKTYFIGALVLSALVLLFSCDANKLELKNPNQLSPDTYFTTAAQVQSAVNAVYGSLQTTGMYNRGMWYGNDNMGHENTCMPQQEADKRQWLNFTFDATHGLIEAYWNSCYRGINKANFVINNEELIKTNIPTSILSDEMRNKYIGEAKFMRALYYFFLVDKFGDVPLYLGVDPAESAGLARAPKEQVWAQIEADCLDAAAKCRAKAVEDVGRATSGAAWGLLGKARLFQKNYPGALEAFSNVTGYSLEPVYFNNFMEETENGPESLFEVQWNIAAGYSSQWNSDRTDEGLNEACFRGQEYGCLNWFNVFPSQDLWDEFETAADNGVKTDPRRGYCIYQTGDLYNNNTLTITIDSTIVYAKDGVTVIDHYKKRGWRKYQNYYKAATEGAVAGNESGINMKVIRYADILLMMAEAEANKPGGSLTTAVGYMNQVRARADVNLPLYGSAEMDVNYPVSNLAQFMVALEHERKVELCGEQVRFPDLVRWGRLAAFIADVQASCPIADKAANVFQSPKNLLYPIPQTEINVNPNIEQTDQNPGY